MWEPKRIVSSLTPPELEFMEVATLPAGISNGAVTAGVLAGRLGSSTRAELAVGLAALAKLKSSRWVYCPRTVCCVCGANMKHEQYGPHSV